MNSILDSIKKILGMDSDYTAFDTDIILAINTAFFTLWQLGVGPQDSPFSISGSESTWDEVVDEGKIEMYKSYIGLRVRLLFDPPTSSFLVEAINAQIKEYEWRMICGMDEYNCKES